MSFYPRNGGASTPRRLRGGTFERIDTLRQRADVLEEFRQQREAGELFLDPVDRAGRKSPHHLAGFDIFRPGTRRADSRVVADGDVIDDPGFPAEHRAIADGDAPRKAHLA